MRNRIEDFSYYCEEKKRGEERRGRNREGREREGMID